LIFDHFLFLPVFLPTDLTTLHNSATLMSNLVMISANKSRGGDWYRDDYDVRDKADRVVGRIMRHPQAPKDRLWFWSIVQGIKPAIDSRGYKRTLAPSNFQTSPR